MLSQLNLKKVPQRHRGNRHSRMHHLFFLCFPQFSVDLVDSHLRVLRKPKIPGRGDGKWFWPIFFEELQIIHMFICRRSSSPDLELYPRRCTYH